MRRRPIQLAAAVIAAAGLTLAAGCGAQPPEEGTRVVVDMSPLKGPSEQFKPPVSAKAAKASGPTLVAQGQNIRVERVTIDQPVTVHGADGKAKQTRSVLRITIEDKIRAGALPPVVHVGAVVVGPAVESDDLDSITVAVADESGIKQGAKVGYGYGNGPAKFVGTLRMVK